MGSCWYYRQGCQQLPSIHEKVIELGRKKMEEYVTSHPPVATLPKFYIVFLNQPQISCDTHGLSDVFCV